MPTSSASFLAHAGQHADACRKLRSALALKWTYDPFYYAMAASIEAGDIQRVGDVFRADLPSAWTAETLPDADGDTRELAAWAGGLQGAQQLYCGALGETALFSTVWPWTEDDGATVRIGLWHQLGGIADRGPLAELLQQWFVD